MANPSDHPSVHINTLIQKSKGTIQWDQEGNPGNYTCRAFLTLPGIGNFEAEGGHATAKSARAGATQALAELLISEGVLPKNTVLSSWVAPGTTQWASRSEREAKRQRTGELSTPAGSGVLAKASQGAGAVTKPPLVVINEMAQVNKIEIEWIWGPPTTNGWSVFLVVTDGQGKVTRHAGAALVKKEAQAIAAAKYLSVAAPALAPKLSPASMAPGSAGSGGIKRPLSKVTPPQQTQQQAWGQSKSWKAGAVKEDCEETYWYNYATARSRLNEYLSRRKMSNEIPTSGPPTGPHTATLEIPLGRGRWVNVFHSASTKKDAMKNCALKAVIELCKMGELPPFTSKKELQDGGLTPMPAYLGRGAARWMDQCFQMFQLPHPKENVPNILANQRNASILLDFDASPWASTAKPHNITWSAPDPSVNPWSTKHPEGELHDQGAMDEQIMMDLDNKLKNPEYQSIANLRTELPISYMEVDILTTIESKSVVLLAGSTGCGKTTQLPQMILDSAAQEGRGSQVNIICTQPRRIAAITVAERVARERMETVGQSVGYKVRFNSKIPRGYGSVCYMTTGMLLRTLTSAGLHGVSHVIVDEVHERDLDTDFLLCVLRRLLPSAPGLKVILMSATMDLDKWAAYFKNDIGVIEVPGRLFPVDLYYLKEAFELAGWPATTQLRCEKEDVPVDLVVDMIQRVAKPDYQEQTGGGAVLVFFPGWDSMEAARKKLSTTPAASMITLHMLHSKVPKEEQQAAFQPAPQGSVKVVLSTNIAESSVTIADVVFVIDTCRVKQLVPTQSSLGRTGYRLTNVPASKQQLQQRAGRAGRVKQGVCFRLIPRESFETLPMCLNPEMVRLPLHQVCLTLKAMGLGSCEQFLAQAPDAPKRENVQMAIETLQDIKAFDSQERITTLGTKLANLPIEPRMGFALLTACTMQLGEPLTIICAFLNSPPLHENEWRFKDNCQSSRNTPASNYMSDHLDALHTFYRLRNMHSWDGMAYCRQNMINYQTFRHMADVTDQTLNLLSASGFPQECLAPCEDWILQLGTPRETEAHRAQWSMLTFLIGLGVEHFAVRSGMGRKVVLGPAAKSWQLRHSQVSASAGVTECPSNDPRYPFVLFDELRETEWKTSCRNVSCASPIAALLGAARDIAFDSSNSCVMLDGWAPISMDVEMASRLATCRLALRSCILSASEKPEGIPANEVIATFREALKIAVHPVEDASRSNTSWP